jgi:Zn finger protein HypA/HybF involved in hydrogenase expression
MSKFKPYTKKDKQNKNDKLVHVEDVTVLCADCNKSLVIIRVVSDTDQISNLKCNCPYCNGSSFVTRVKGKIYIDYCEGINIDDIDYPVGRDGKYDEVSTINIKVLKK